jgi:hypothetical protein
MSSSGARASARRRSPRGRTRTYRIAVDGENGGTGLFASRMAFARADGGPANDYSPTRRRSKARAEASPDSTVNATAEPGEPIHSGLSCCLNDERALDLVPLDGAGERRAFFTTGGQLVRHGSSRLHGASVDALVSQDVYWNDANPCGRPGAASSFATSPPDDVLPRGRRGERLRPAPFSSTGGRSESTGDPVAPTVQIPRPERGADVQGQVVFLADRVRQRDGRPGRLPHRAEQRGGGARGTSARRTRLCTRSDFELVRAPAGPLRRVSPTPYDTSGNSASFTSRSSCPLPHRRSPSRRTSRERQPARREPSVKFSVHGDGLHRRRCPRDLQALVRVAVPARPDEGQLHAPDSYGNTVGRASRSRLWTRRRQR